MGASLPIRFGRSAGERASDTKGDLGGTNMPRLTVVMPAYNAAATIGTAVRSTLRALPRGAGLLVVDDGSADGTPEILEGLGAAHPQLRWHRFERNRGVGAALAWLVDHAEAPLIARMDADDVCLPWRFAPTLVRMRRARADLCFTGALNVDDDLRPLRPTVPWPLGPAAAPYDLLVDNGLFHGGLIARRETLQELGGYRDVEAEDYDLWLRAASSGHRILRVPWQGYLYRTHPTQVTSTQGHYERLRGSSEIAQAHSDLSRVALGRRIEAFRALHTRADELDETDRAVIRQLHDALEEAIARDPSLGRTDRLLLRRRRLSRLRTLAGGR